MTQQLGFQLRDNALVLFEGADWLVRARGAAWEHLLEHQTVTIEDVYAKVGRPERVNSAGSVFLVKGFRLVGYQPSSRPTRHANRVGVWERA